MHVKPELVIHHPFITAAEKYLRDISGPKLRGTAGEIRAAEKEVRRARVQALAHIVSEEFSREEIEELTHRLHQLR